jgi:hypothetical protein
VDVEPHLAIVLLRELQDLLLRGEAGVASCGAFDVERVFDPLAVEAIRKVIMASGLLSGLYVCQ